MEDLKTALKVHNEKETRQQILLDRINDVVLENFMTLIAGADKLNDPNIEVIEADHWAPLRILVKCSDGRYTRLHARQGVKAIAGLKTVDGREQRDESRLLNDKHIHMLVETLNKLFQSAADTGNSKMLLSVHYEDEDNE